MADVVGHDGEMGAAEFPPQAVVDLPLVCIAAPGLCLCLDAEAFPRLRLAR